MNEKSTENDSLKNYFGALHW